MLFRSGTNKEQKITIKSNSGLTDEEIERMMNDAKANEEADAKRKEEVDLRNEVDQLIFQTEKTLKEVGDKLPETDTAATKTALEDLKKAQADDNIDDMKAKKDALSEAAQELAVKLYQQSEAAQGQASEADGKATDGKTVDGDFEEVDPKK